MAVRPPLPDVLAPDAWEIYKQLPGMLLGFHGCDRKTADTVLAKSGRHLKVSRNEYDWLGEGIYFWEGDPWRALDWANTTKNSPRHSAGKVDKPQVIGAVLDLGHCLNLLDFGSLRELKKAHGVIDLAYRSAGETLPENRGGPDQVLRFRDKAVVNAVHEIRVIQKLPPYQSVRAAFPEGDELYPGSGFRNKNHIQIAVRDLRCVKGYFRPPGL